MELVDPRLGSDYNKEEVMLAIDVAFLCTNVSATGRPTMSSVVSMLEGKVALKELISDSSVSNESVEAMKSFYQKIQGTSPADSQTQSISIDAPWSSSSASVPDLYPVNPDSNYWDNRNKDV